jgi:uncharacterized protein (DUF1499 family)
MKSNFLIKRTPNIVKALFGLSVIAAALFILSGYGYQWEIWSLGTAFDILTKSVFASIGLVLLNLVALYMVYKSNFPKGYYYVLAGLVLTAAVFGTARYWQVQAQSVPPIHDITTDMENPPEFDVLADIRADSPNPPEYEGEEVAEAQREAYPDIETLFLSSTYEDVFNSVVTLIELRGWELVNADSDSGIVEATEKLAWFGFKDDVVIRIDAIDSETRVDMRSKSRIGQSDLGVNAKRIRSFLNDLNSQFN